jgi:hypothetical protein
VAPVPIPPAPETPVPVAPPPETPVPTPLEPEAPVPTPPAPEPPPPAPGAEEDGWLDVTHGLLETRLLEPILRFDRFFSDERDLEEERARSFLRWRNEIRLDEEEHPALTTGVHANLRLPGLGRVLRRVRVVIAGGTRDTIGALFPDDPAQQGRSTGGADAELRLGLFDALGAHADLGAGLLLQLPVGVFARAGLRWRVPAGDLFMARLALSGFWRTDTRFGTRADVRLERPLFAAAVLRAGSELLLTEVSEGVEWRPDAGVIVGLGSRTAASLLAGALVTSEGRPHVDRYRLGLRLRRDIHRRWLFLEIEPEIYWPWSAELRRHAVWAAMLRLEIQFHGSATARATAAEASPISPGR